MPRLSHDFITRTILGEAYRSFSSSLCSFLHSPVISSLLDPNILLSNVSDQVSHPYKTTGRITVLCILIFKFLDSKLDMALTRRFKMWMIYSIKNSNSCNVKNLKDTEEALKRQSMLLHIDLSVILTILTVRSIAWNVQFYGKRCLHRLVQHLQTLQFTK